MHKRDSVVMGEKLWFGVATGVVKGLRIWTRTEIFGGGGGGYIGQYGGYLAPINIHSRSTTYREFWVVEPNGVEHHVLYDQNAFSVRDGQMVHLVWGASVRQSTGPYIGMMNPSYKANYLYTLSSDASGTLRMMGVKKGSTVLTFIILSVIFTAVLGSLTGFASILLDFIVILILAGICSVITESVRSKWLNAITQAAANSIQRSDAPVIVSTKPKSLLANGLVAALVIFCGLFLFKFFLLPATHTWRSITGNMAINLDAIKDPQGTGPFRNRTYTAAEIKNWYSVPWTRKNPLRLVGNHITVTGDLDGVNILGMGNMDFLGSLTNSKVVDYYGLITVASTKNTTLVGNDIKVKGAAVNTTKVIDGYFPRLRSGQTLASKVPEHNR